MKKKQLTFCVSLSLSIIICVLIYIFSSQNGDASGSVSEGLTRRLFPLIASDSFVFFIEHILRKIAHFLIYLTLGIAVCITYDSSVQVFKAKISGTVSKVFIPLMFCFLYSVTDEIHQCFVPDRNGSFVDCLLDTSGALCGIMIVILFGYIIRSFKHNRI